MATSATMTGAAFDQIPCEQGRNLELLDGEIITLSTPTPEHEIIVIAFVTSFREYLRREPRGGVLTHNEYALGEDTRLQPAVSILLGERWTSLNRRKTPIPGAPDIAIEVISPSETNTGSLRKVRKYLRAGVQEIWQVVAETQQVFIHTGTKSITVLELDDHLRTPLLPDWSLDLHEIFQT